MLDPIAIVGASCRYPDADDPDQLWETVMAGRRAFRPIPSVRLNLDDYSSAGTGEVDSTYARFAAVLEGWSFDRARFRVPGPVHRVTDTTHWLALEVAADALAAAGHPEGRGLDRDRVSVVIGNTMNGEFSRAGALRLRWPYVRRLLQQALSTEGWGLEQQARFVADFEQAYKSPFPEPNDESLAGGLSNTIAGRVCNHFDLHGGGYTVDGACSSSLLAVITAAKALRAGEVDVAIAGGVDLSLDPFELVGFARTGALATNDMRIYDADPTGFWPGEGCGMVVLMRAEDALAAGRPVLAVIQGWGVSSDGRGGITRPEKNGQLLAVRRAYEHTGFGPESVALFEGHGTGTAVGDPVEIAALIEAQRGLRTTTPAALGSIKANIGHTKAAAGVAGLLKAVLAVQRQVIPPTTGCEDPHESLRGERVPLRVVGEPEPWPQDVPLRAGVSAMGFGGINTHLVLESPAARRRPVLGTRKWRPLRTEVFAFAADSREELLARLDRTAEVAAVMSFAEQVDLAAAAASAAAGDLKRFRAAVVASDPDQLARRARQAAQVLAGCEDDGFVTLPGVAVGTGRAGRLGLVFTGQGAALPEHAGALGVVLPELRDLFGAPPPKTEPGDTAVAQPAIVRASLAGLRWLDRLGVVAGGAVGHSLGEITALHWAGALTEEQVLDLVTARGRIMREYGAPSTGMLSVVADRDLTAQLIAGTDLVIAADHGHAHVVAGPTWEFAQVMRRAQELRVTTRRLEVSHGFHSPAFLPARPTFEQYLRQVRIDPPARPVYSTITGALLEEKADLRELLLAQLTEPVLFRQAVTALARTSELLVEIGPGRTLASLTAELTGVPTLSLEAGADSASALCQVSGALHALGVARDLRPLFAGRFHRDFELWREPRFLESPCERAPATTPLPAISATPADTPESAPQADPHRDAAATVRDLVAQALELPMEAISDDDKLLSDLHLNSLRVVQIAAQAAAACGRAVPVEPLVLSDVSITELAQQVEALPAATDDVDEGANVPGVAAWHRILLPRRHPVTLPEESVDATWRVRGGGPLRAEVEARISTHDLEAAAELVFLPEDPSDEEVAELIDVARTAVDASCPLAVVDHGDTASGFLATIRQEHPELAVRWIGARSPGAAETVAHILGLPPHHLPELLVDDEGAAHRLTHAPVTAAPGAPFPLGGQDLVLVTGGGKGIGFRTAQAMGRLSGARLVLLGRSDPERDDELRANLASLTALELPHSYVVADVTDPASVRRALDAVVAEHGPVTALVHSSGINHPRRFTDLRQGDYADHAAPKHHGLREILAVLDTAPLRLLITYGSVIGRFGLPGEAHYALANGRMRELARVTARDLPHCRVHNIDWTAWSGAGMGERLDVLDSLLRAGVVPLPAARGAELLEQLLTSGIGEPSVVVTGRLPHLNDERAPGEETYLRRIRALVPGVELVAEADLDLDHDSYLLDHRIDGLVLLPAVCAMEAMAEAAAMLTGRPVTGLSECRFDRPVIVPDEGNRTIRICALADENGEIDVVVRSDESGYAVDHFSARVSFADAEPVTVVAGRSSLPLPAHEGGDLYGPTFFHGPLFRRLRAYEHLEATSCVAILEADDRWDAARALLLGDPTLNDATIHVLQGCVPNRRLLPVGCDAFTVHSARTGAGDLVLTAAEHSRSGAEHVYDVSVRDSLGHAVLSWQGLRLRDIGSLEPDAGWPPVVLGTYLQRSLEALLPDTPVQIEVVAKAGGPAAGRSQLDELVLQVSGPAALACDWEWVSPEGPGSLHTPTLLAGQREQIAKLTGEPDKHTLTRLWTVRACLSKSGQSAAQAPLTVQGVFEQGWVILRSGSDLLGSVVIRMAGVPRPIAVSIMVKGGS